MKLIEQFLCGKKNNPEVCEDGLVIGKHLIAVIDGVTAKGNRLWDGKSSGCYAKQVLADYLQRQAVEKQDAAELFGNLDRILRENVQSHAEALPLEEYPRAVVILYNDLYKEIWSYGDCPCSINGALRVDSKKIDEMNADLRAFYLEYQILQGADIKELAQDDPGRKEIQQNLMKQFAFENKPGYFGYPTLNGRGMEPSMIKRYPVKEGDVVILASDGYPVLKETLEECEAELDYINQHDPMYFRLHRSTKGIMPGNISFDDRAFCKFIV